MEDLRACQVELLIGRETLRYLIITINLCFGDDSEPLASLGSLIIIISNIYWIKSEFSSVIIITFTSIDIELLLAAEVVDYEGDNVLESALPLL